MFDYETMRLIWWVLLGVILGGFALTDGFDMGVAMLLPFTAKKDMERRVVINTVGPVWEGNQVWIVLGGGAIFAAWPLVYAVSFSSLYLAMLAVLAGFILRPVGFKYRSKMPNSTWRSVWDWVIFTGGFIPSLLFGVAVGNVLMGIPFHFDESLRVFYTGTFWQLLNPFALLCGVVSVCMLTMHGGFYLVTKTEGDIAHRAKTFARISCVLLIVLFALAGVYVAYGLKGYMLTSTAVFDGPSNPLYKTALQEAGAWLTNYVKYPWMIAAPILGFLGALGALCFGGGKSGKVSFIFSGFAIAGIIATVGFTMFPFILPSSSMPSESLTVWDASSSLLTLRIMLFVTAIFLPLILIYTAWVYRVMKGKVTETSINKDSQQAY